MNKVNIFEFFYAEALGNLKSHSNLNAGSSPIAAIWAHKDGRCLAMTAFTSHVISEIPAGFVRGVLPLQEDVDIFVPEQK